MNLFEALKRAVSGSKIRRTNWKGYLYFKDDVLCQSNILNINKDLLEAEWEVV